MLLQTRWASELNPVLRTQILNGNLLKNVALIAGVNNINHLLSRTQQGWFLTDIDAAATIYRSAAFNDKTLQLTSSAAAQASIWVF